MGRTGLGAKRGAQREAEVNGSVLPVMGDGPGRGRGAAEKYSTFETEWCLGTLIQLRPE